MAVTLLLHDGHIAAREYALLVCSLIAALGPVGVHELVYLYPVVGEDGEVPGIRGIVGIDRGSGGDCRRPVCGWWGGRRRSRVVKTGRLLFGE